MELSVLLFACAKHIGLSEPPTPETIRENSQFIFRQFGDFTSAEVNEAFDMYCGGKLDCDKSHYNSFSFLFIGSVLRSYRSYREVQIAKNRSIAKKKSEEERAKEQPEPLTKEERLEQLEKYLFRKFAQYKLDKVYTWSRLDEKILYMELESIGVLSFTDKEKIDFAKTVVRPKLLANIIQHVKEKNATKTKDGFEFEPVFFKNECQRAVVRQWIEMADFEETDIRELITEKIK